MSSASKYWKNGLYARIARMNEFEPIESVTVPGNYFSAKCQHCDKVYQIEQHARMISHRFDHRTNRDTAVTSASYR